MNSKVKDSVAVKFSEYFYHSLGQGKNLKDIIELTKINLSTDEDTKDFYHDTKVECEIPNSIDPADLYLLETRETELNQYLHDVLHQSTDDIDVKHIEEREAVYLDVNTEWSSDDIEIREKHAEEIMDFNTQLNKFLEKSESDRLLFIATPFGVGKSVLVKKIASEYAARCKKNNDEYVPVYVPLKNGLNRVYSGSLSNLLDNIIAYAKHDRKILLILDSLDEYENQNHGNLKELNHKIRNELIPRYCKMKIIVTSRVNIDFPKIFEINGQKYLRLLLFTPKQVTKFFEINNSKLTYENAVNYGLEHKDIAKPLLTYMLLKVFPFIDSDLENKHQDFTSNMFRSFIYFHFLSHIADGKQIERGVEFKISNGYLDEKNALRKLALLKQIHKDTLTKNMIVNEAEFFGFKSDALHLNPILTCYLYSNPSSDEETDVNFIHETFKEYLMAENYLEALIKGENKVAWMNVGKPSKETINFLDGLLQLLTTDDKNIKKHVEYNKQKQISLFNLFSYDKPIYDAVYNIINNAIDNLNDESVTVFSPDHVTQIPWIRAEGQMTVNEYPSLWIHRWISLYVLYKLGFMNNYKLGFLNKSGILERLGLYKVEGSEKIESLLKFSRLFRVCSDSVLPNFKNLRGFDLSGINLSGS